MIVRQIDDKYVVKDTQAEQKNELMAERIGEKRVAETSIFYCDYLLCICMSVLGSWLKTDDSRSDKL